MECGTLALGARPPPGLSDPKSCFARLVQAVAALVRCCSERVAATSPAMLRFLKGRIKSGESLLGAAMPTMPGLLLSHFFQTEKDELDFWKAVKTGGVGSALSADKSRKAAAEQAKEAPNGKR